jgi:hypothetical protein
MEVIFGESQGLKRGPNERRKKRKNGEVFSVIGSPREFH